jgi:bacterioferritin-associated ferredoxin
VYVCLCNGITERDIRNCVQQGACCMSDLRRELGVANQCGCCEEYARQCLAEAADAQATPAAV